MTHDELLAEIDRLDAVLTDSYGMSALRAVVELHKPFIFEGKETNLCDGCTQCWGCGEWGASADCPCDKYPCPTIKAIEKELF